MGALAVLVLAAVLCLGGIFRPWIGFAGYAFFAVLCPQWNWRWSLPDLDYQKLLAVSTLTGFLLSGLSRNRLNSEHWRPIALLVVYLGLAYLSGMQSISPLRSALFLDTSWKIVLMSILGVLVLRESRQLLWLGGA